MYSFSSKCVFICFFSETIMFLHEIFHQGLKARLANWPTLVLGKQSCIKHTSKHCVHIHHISSVTRGWSAPSRLVCLIYTRSVLMILSLSHTQTQVPISECPNILIVLTNNDIPNQKTSHKFSLWQPFHYASPRRRIALRGNVAINWNIFCLKKGLNINIKITLFTTC